MALACWQSSLPSLAPLVIFSRNSLESIAFVLGPLTCIELGAYGNQRTSEVYWRRPSCLPVRFWAALVSADGWQTYGILTLVLEPRFCMCTWQDRRGERLFAQACNKASNDGKLVLARLLQLLFCNKKSNIIIIIIIGLISLVDYSIS